MKSHYAISRLLVLGVLLVGCDNTVPPSEVQKSGEANTPEKIMADLTKAAAAQGDASAQITLGTMYDDGVGVPKDPARAIEWWQKAAAQGDVSAQILLATMYAYGKRVPESTGIEWTKVGGPNPGVRTWTFDEVQVNLLMDKVLAYAWYNLAASSGKELVVEEGAKQRSIVERQMTRAEIAEAQRLSSAWKRGQILTREGR